jgi:hypothetical protein
MSSLIYFNDDTIRETLRKFVEEKLNKAGKVNDIQLVDFVGVKDFIEVDDNLVKAKQLDGTFRTVDEEYTLAVLDEFNGGYEPVKDLKVIIYSMPIKIMASTNKKYTEIKESLDRFKSLMIGEDYTYDGYKFGTSITALTSNERVTTINGVDYVMYRTTLSIIVTEDALIGNFIETYFGENKASAIRLYPIERNSTRAYIPEETQKNKEKESKTIYKESVWAGNISIIVNKTKPLYKTLIQEHEAPSKLNKTWYYATRYDDLFYDDQNQDPDHDKFEKIVGPQTITIDAEIGIYVIITLQLKLSGM